MYDLSNPFRASLLKLQEISGNKVADKKRPLLFITLDTKGLVEKKCVNVNNELPITYSCLLGACGNIDIFGKDEADSILKSSSFLKWMERKFCILTGNSLLKTMLSENGFEVYDLSQVDTLIGKL
jgi:hypothetical protein